MVHPHLHSKSCIFVGENNEYLNEEIDLEVDYNGDGAFSKITAKYYSTEAMWNVIINAINQIKA